LVTATSQCPASDHRGRIDAPAPGGHRHFAVPGERCQQRGLVGRLVEMMDLIALLEPTLRGFVKRTEEQYSTGHETASNLIRRT
jgi:hypothetical protein